MKMTAKDRSNVVLVLIALVVGFAVFRIGTIAAWREYATDDVSFRQKYTRMQLKQIDKAVQEYQQTNGSLPTSLSDLTEAGSDFVGVYEDSWRHPITYTKENDSYVVRSYGRDGNPGGVGIDYDLTASNPDPPEAMPTFDQFLHDLPSGGMIKSCIFCGVLAFVLTLVLVKSPQFTLRGTAQITLKVVATVIGSVLVASAMSALHIPSGH